MEVRGTARLMVSVGAVLALAACGTPSAGADACPQTYAGQRVNLKGTVTAVLAIGGYFLTIARDSTGQTCQLVMPSKPRRARCDNRCTGLRCLRITRNAAGFALSASQLRGPDDH